MKTKYFKSGLLFAAFAMLFSACNSDRDDNPTLGPNHTAKSFVVNTSAVADQYIQLSEDNKVNLTWSQPDYGVNTVVHYKVQVGLAEGTDVRWGDYLDTDFTTCNVDMSGAQIAKVLCTLDGFKTEDEYVPMGFRKVAMRVTANIQTTSSKEVEGTSITSNTVYFNNMAAYNNVPTKGKLFIIGNCCGWTEPVAGNKQKLIDEGWYVEETEIGSQKYHGVIDMPAGELVFRFYSKLEGWGDDSDASKTSGSIGWQLKDSDSGDKYTLPLEDEDCTPGKGSWKFADFPGGKLDITVNLGTNKVSFVLQ